MSTSTDPVVLSAARWFWWIAGLSLVNTVLFHSGSDLNFVVGLGITTLVNVVFANNLPVAIVLAVAAIAFYFVIGLLAQQERLWAFYLGLVIYVLDALVYVVAEDWMPVAFHALAIFYIAKGVLQLRGRHGTSIAQSEP